MDLTLYRTTLRTLRWIWGAFLVTPVTLGVVLAVIRPPGDPELAHLGPLLALVALGTFPMIFVLRRVLLGGFGFVEPEDLRHSEATPLTPERLKAVAGKAQTAGVVSLALAENQVVLGFVGSFLTGDLLWFAALGASGVLTLLACFPRRALVFAALEPGERHTLREALGG